MRKRSRNKKDWEENAVRDKGRVRRYLKRTYGSRAFHSNGNIRMDYLDKAKARAKKSGNTSLERAIVLAKTLKHSRK